MKKKHEVREIRQHRPMRRRRPGDANEVAWNKPDRPRIPDDPEAFEENWNGVDWERKRQTCEKETTTKCGTMSRTVYRRK